MCRFLLIKSKKEIKLTNLLNDFADKCRTSNEWQGDGWGISWKVEDRGWRIEKSLRPIWEDVDKFDKIPKSKFFVVHARSASFPKHNGFLDYNQPYLDKDLIFVFNGELYGVSVRAPGNIGAQKIFWLLNKDRNQRKTVVESLKNVRDLLISNSKSMLGMNMGLFHEDAILASCYYQKNAQYYTLHFMTSDSLSMISSEKIGNFSWQQMKKGDIIQL